MKKRGSAGMKKPVAGSMEQAQASKSQDLGLGPEPPRYSPEWMEWMEDQALLAGLDQAAKALPKDAQKG